MRLIFTFMCLLLAAAVASAQGSMWRSAVAPGMSASAAYSSTVIASAVDAAGYVYQAGQFSGGITFGGTTLTSAGSTDVFVVKWNPNTASVVWVQQAGGPGRDAVNGLALNGSSVYVVGTYQNTATFGSLSVAGAGADDGFVAKLNDTGPAASFYWVQAIRSPDAEAATAVAVVGSAVYVTGNFNNTIALGSNNLATAGGVDAFVERLNDNGSAPAVAWAVRGGGAGLDAPFGLALNGTSVYISGYFTGLAETFGATTLASAGSYDVFVAKLTDAGTSAAFGWALRAGGTGDDLSYGLVANGSDLYLAGGFGGGTAAFGATTLTNASSPITFTDGFVAKLTDGGSGGSFVWAKSIGGAAGDLAVGLTYQTGHVYVTGYFAGSAAIFGTHSLASAGGKDVFLAGLLDLGSAAQVQLAERAGSAGDDQGFSVQAVGNLLYVSGVALVPAAFGAYALAGPVGTPEGFVATVYAVPTGVAPGAGPAVAFGLFPNPAHGRATVQLPPGAGPATLTVLDALGRALRTQTATGSKAELDLIGLVPGLHAVRVATGGGTATQKLVVE
ncbi:T9SS type A sorting domain-containing protein [Hymenobacter sp. M29]|uniref:T9SS type A sorting domain-containing protein n=1 Tax=Hymenobacter mellowenesis TaxID=3063995 RepID=A0ABT9A6G7_9BACT|nr:T9SS type A sorting domain-containing protein [Hymenobacter sp. M29]MDO7844954.1 T9SS type A sorting domain-containing protein [Hymenobacter sp. M29]